MASVHKSGRFALSAEVQSAAAALREMAEKATADGARSLGKDNTMTVWQFDRWFPSVLTVWCWNDFSRKLLQRFRAISSSPRFGRDIQKIWNCRQLLLVMFDLFVPNFAGPRSPSGESSHWGLIFRFKIVEPNSLRTYNILSLFPAKVAKAEDFVTGPFPEATAATQATWKSCINTLEHLADLRLCMSI